MTTTAVTQPPSVCVDTPDGIAFAQLLAFRGRLQIEEATGMRSRIPTLKRFNKVYGLSCRTRADAIVTIGEVIRLIREEDNVLFPIGDGTVGLFDRQELLADLRRQGALVEN